MGRAYKRAITEGNRIIKLYPCDPKRNKECKKTHCHISGGPCSRTSKKNQRYRGRRKINEQL